MAEKSNDGRGAPTSPLGDIEFHHTARQQLAKTLERILLTTTVAVASALLGGVILSALLRSTALDSRSLVGVAAIFAIVTLALTITLRTGSERSVSISDGVIALEHPIRRRTGGRSRQIRLEEIVEVEPTIAPGGYNGVALRLADGTSFFLAQSTFGDRGIEIMERLSTAFGRSYLAEIRKMLLEGPRYGFRLAEPIRIDGTVVVLGGRLRTASGTGKRKIDLTQVKIIERVSTPYTGSAFLVTLNDGTSVLVRTKDAERVGLPLVPAWSSKVK